MWEFSAPNLYSGTIRMAKGKAYRIRYQSRPWVQFLRPNPTEPNQPTKWPIHATQPNPYHSENLDAGPNATTTQPNQLMP